MKNWFTLPAIALLIACSSNVEKENEQLFDQVMEIHDSIMPEMGAIRTTRKGIVDMMTAETDSLKLQALSLVSEELDQAHKGMMVWMRQFEPDYEGTPEEKNAYLKKEKEKMVEVKDKMVVSLKKGKELLGQ